MTLVQERAVHSVSLHAICELLSVYLHTVELQWLEHYWNHENMFETGVVRASEYKS